MISIHKNIAHDIISKTDDHMTIKVKSLGIIDRFNDVDVEQTRFYTKIHNCTYITKIVENKLFTDEHSQFSYLPTSEDKDYNKFIESATPLDDKELQTCEKEFNFTYRQGIGELVYAMVTCRLDISFPLIKLIQYSSAPSRKHFKAVHGIFTYLRQTLREGIYYWRKIPRPDLPIGKIPNCSKSNNYTPQTREQQDSTNVRATVDSDYAGDTSHMRLVTGISVNVARCCVYYKTQFQTTIALSTTEAEFVAACEAAKVIIYIRSIL